MQKRIFFNIMLFLAVFFVPWWAVLLLGALASFLWAPYYEIVAFGVLVDILYGATTLPLGGIFGVVAAVVIFIVASFVRGAVR